MFGGDQRQNPQWSTPGGQQGGGQHPPAQSSSSNSGIIPGATSFYNPSAVGSQPQPSLEDHPWIHPTAQQFASSLDSGVYNIPYRQQQSQASRVLHESFSQPQQQTIHPQQLPQTQQQAAPHLLNQYNFVPQSRLPQQAQFTLDQQTYGSQVSNQSYLYGQVTPNPPATGQDVSSGSYPYPQFQIVNPSLSKLANKATPSSSSELLAFPPRGPSVSPAVSDQSSQRNVSESSPPPQPTASTSATNLPAPATESNTARNKAVKSNKRRKVLKRTRPDDESSSDTDEDEVSGGVTNFSIHLTQPPRGSDFSFPTRLPGACTHCKKLKMKCDFPRHENVCKRCKTGGHRCVVEGRKPRSAPNKREYLLAQIKQKDAIIESLLKQLHNPYVATPLAIAAYRSSTSPSDENKQSIVDWLDKLTASYNSDVKAAGGTMKSQSFTFTASPKDTTSDSDSDGDGMTTVLGEGTQGDLNSDEEAGGDSGIADKAAGALPDVAVPIGLIANLSLSNDKSSTRKSHNNDDDLGIANPGYFKEGAATDLGLRASLIEQHTPPEILVHGLVTPTDVEKLFSIFYTKLNPHVSLLDPSLHTPASTFTRCPFLFTVVCAVSSRYYREKSDIYPIAMHFARHEAANALIDGWKSVELCQAYILLNTYGVPARRWEEDRSWLYIGLAIRIATDLNLFLPQPKKLTNENQEREALNKTRTWLICHNLDRSTATQFGKPPSIKEDSVIRNSADWYKKSKFNDRYDVGLCAYTSLMRIVAKFHEELFSDPDTATGLNKSIDFKAVTKHHDDKLTMFNDEWKEKFAENDTGESSYAFRCSLLPFLVGYSRLVMHSFGFQCAFEKRVEADLRHFYTKCFDAATSVIKIMIETLAPSRFMLYSPDGHFVFTSFASAFLLKLLRPEFSWLVEPDDKTKIFDLIGRLIQILNSPDVSIDNKHTPRLHAKFLTGLLKRYHPDSNRDPLSQAPLPPSKHTVGGGPTSHKGQPRSSDRPGTYFGHGTTQSTQSGVGNVSYPSDQNMPSQLGISYVDGTPQYQPQTSDSVVDSAVNAMAGLSEEDMLATLRTIGNPVWWSTMMMPGFSWASPSPTGSPKSSGTIPAPSFSSSSSLAGATGLGGFDMYQSAQTAPISLR